MPNKKIENLMSELHGLFGSDMPSPQQQKLLEDLQAHIHSSLEPDPLDPSLTETAEMLVESIEQEHPRAVAIIRDILDTLKNIGV
jgi:predicted DNA-binding transcriptional regulator YafY